MLILPLTVPVQRPPSSTQHAERADGRIGDGTVQLNNALAITRVYGRTAFGYTPNKLSGVIISRPCMTDLPAPACRSPPPAFATSASPSSADQARRQPGLGFCRCCQVSILTILPADDQQAFVQTALLQVRRGASLALRSPEHACLSCATPHASGRVLHA